MKKLLFVLLIQSFVNANVIDGNTDAIASPRDLSLNTIEAGGLYTDAQTTSVKNYVLTNLSGQDRLWTFTTTSLLVLENTTLDLDGTFTFTHGSIKIVGNCAINGSSDFNKFRFESHLIHIENNSELRIGPGVNFEYAPTGSTRSGIMFGNSSSKLTLEDSTLTISNKYGLNLIRGTLKIDGNSIVDNFFTGDNVQYLDHLASFTDKALVLGNGPTSYGDCKLQITSGSKLTVKNAGIIYRNIGAGAFDGADGSGILVVDKKGSFLIESDADFNSGGISLNFNKLESMVELGSATSITPIETVNYSASGNDWLYEVDWTPDGKYLAVGGRGWGAALIDNQIEIYSFNGYVLTSIINAPFFSTSSVVDACKWSPDGKYLAAVGYTAGTSQVDVFAFNPNGPTLDSLGPWNFGASADWCTGCEWSPDGKYLFVTGASKVEIYRFDGSSLTSVGNWAIAIGPTDISLSRDGKYLLGAGGGASGQVVVYRFNSTQSGSNMFTLVTNADYFESNDVVRDCMWSPDGRYLVVGGNTGTSSQIEIYSFDGTSLTSLGNWDFYQTADFVYSCKWSNDGKYILFSGSTDSGNQIQMNRFDPNKIGQDILTFVGRYTFYPASSTYFIQGSGWLPDGKNFVVGGGGSSAEFNQVGLYSVDITSDDQKLSTFKNANIKLDKDLMLRDINLKMK